MRSVAAIALAILVGAGTCALAGPAPPGESIYRDGVLGNGQPLSGMRSAGMETRGSDAACVNCHRRSGLGMKEGQSSIPPISGIYLFQPRAKDQQVDLPYVDGMRGDRDPYTDATLARAIREGVAVDGKPLSYLMPRYALGDADMAALISYLKGLTREPVPGVTDGLLHFATIITPDADPVKRDGMLAVMNQFFADKNAFVRAESPRLHSSRRMMFKAARRWELHVWELQGSPASWEKQLQEYLKNQPVFAVVSGLGGSNWAPVHHFCEQASLPCLFPNVELPVVAERDFYSLYLTKGVLLEAPLMARRLRDAPGAQASARVIQVYRQGDVGEPAAKAFAAAYSGADNEVVNRPLKANGEPRDLVEALKAASAHDTLVLWLRPKDLSMLETEPVRAAQVLMSGTMGGLSQSPLPAAWRDITQMAYPFDLPELRKVRVNYALGWFSLRHIPVVNEQVQVDTYLACGLLSETINHLADTFIRDYLVERVEAMLEHRVVTGYYPRLALGPNQRFASKGGYIVKFAEPQGTRLTAVSDWIAP